MAARSFSFSFRFASHEGWSLTSFTPASRLLSCEEETSTWPYAPWALLGHRWGIKLFVVGLMTFAPVARCNFLVVLSIFLARNAARSSASFFLWFAFRPYFFSQILSRGGEVKKISQGKWDLQTSSPLATSVLPWHICSASVSLVNGIIWSLDETNR